MHLHISVDVHMDMLDGLQSINLCIDINDF